MSPLQRPIARSVFIQATRKESQLWSDPDVLLLQLIRPALGRSARKEATGLQGRFSLKRVRIRFIPVFLEPGRKIGFFDSWSFCFSLNGFSGLPGALTAICSQTAGFRKNPMEQQNPAFWALIIRDSGLAYRCAGAAVPLESPLRPRKGGGATR